MAALDMVTLIGYAHDNREFLVTLLDDGFFIFTWSNGDAMTRCDIQTYCREINGAKFTIESRIQFLQLGGGLPIYQIGSPGVQEFADGIYYTPSKNRIEPIIPYSYPSQRRKDDDDRDCDCRVTSRSRLKKPIHII